jgi:deoxyribose-phosphate aldolase
MLENALPLPVKAAGVRTYDEALEMIRLGVKLGTSEQGHCQREEHAFRVLNFQ